MRRYLLDSAILAAVLNNRPTVVALAQPWIAGHEAATSMLTYGEVIEYLKPRADFTRRHAALRALLRGVYPHFLTYRIVERYADIRLQLRPPHGPGLIGDVDTLIAATALERNLTVVTTDGDFQRMPGLNVVLIPRAQVRAGQLSS
jgi:predicted nucleic acid-binding protein